MTNEQRGKHISLQAVYQREHVFIFRAQCLNELMTFSIVLGLAFDADYSRNRMWAGLVQILEDFGCIEVHLYLRKLFNVYGIS